LLTKASHEQPILGTNVMCACLEVHAQRNLHCHSSSQRNVQFKMHKWMLSLTADQLKYVLLLVQIQAILIATHRQ